MKKIASILLTLCLFACLTCGSAFAGDTENPERAATTLVVYFSATGNTRPLAEYAAAYLHADLYEIVPAQPYTDADLNYNDSGSRSTREHNDDAARPEIDAPLESIDQYDTIFLGYPIWWGEAPRIINAFMESFDFSGKTVVPFCTSASSGMGDSARRLQALYGENATWIDGKRFAARTSEATITAWIDGLKLNASAE